MIFVLTGAGLSAESGLGTFRDEGGLWTQYDLSEVATPEGFAADPEKVLSFYNARRANAAGATPNAAHHALARLSKEASTTLVTQNVDSLLEAAGALNVIHMHGQLNRALCHVCGARWDAPDVMAVTDLCPACAAPATRPDVVWFGEMPYHMEAIEDAMTQADLFVAIGTSGTVLIEGESDVVGRMRKALASGPPSARVDKCSVTEVDSTEAVDFRIR